MFTEEEKLNILADMIKMQSVNDNELQVAQYLQQLFAKYNIEAKIIKIDGNRADLVAEIGDKGPVLGFSGHMDVVAVDKSQWDSDPFVMTERDGKLYGRGTTDMKSGLAAMVIAMIEMKVNNSLNYGRIRLMATMGEEIGEAGSAYFNEHHYMDDVDALVISEPTDYCIVYAEKGSLDFEINSKGKAAHSSMPKLGFNAINPLVDVLTKINDLAKQLPVNDLLGDVTINATVINGGEQVNTIPDFANVKLNARTTPSFDGDQLIAKVNDYINEENNNGAKMQLQVLMNEKAIIEPADSVIANIAADIVKQDGKKVVKTIAPGITDASNLVKDKANNYPFIVFGPGDPRVAHQPNEYVEKDNYLDFINIYQQLAQQYFNNIK